MSSIEDTTKEQIPEKEEKEGKEEKEEKNEKKKEKEEKNEKKKEKEDGDGAKASHEKFAAKLREIEEEKKRIHEKMDMSEEVTKTNKKNEEKNTQSHHHHNTNGHHHHHHHHHQDNNESISNSHKDVEMGEVNKSSTHMDMGDTSDMVYEDISKIYGKVLGKSASEIKRDLQNSLVGRSAKELEKTINSDAQKIRESLNAIGITEKEEEMIRSFLISNPGDPIRKSLAQSLIKASSIVREKETQLKNSQRASEENEKLKRENSNLKKGANDLSKKLEETLMTGQHLNDELYSLKKRKQSTRESDMSPKLSTEAKKPKTEDVKVDNSKLPLKVVRRSSVATYQSESSNRLPIPMETFEKIRSITQEIPNNNPLDYPYHYVRSVVSGRSKSAETKMLLDAIFNTDNDEISPQSIGGSIENIVSNPKNGVIINRRHLHQ